jgi:hypothetical protein
MPKFWIALTLCSFYFFRVERDAWWGAQRNGCDATARRAVQREPVKLKKISWRKTRNSPAKDASCLVATFRQLSNYFTSSALSCFRLVPLPSQINFSVHISLANTGMLQLNKGKRLIRVRPIISPRGKKIFNEFSSKFSSLKDFARRP